jgi:hypothetical protein
MAAPDPSFIDGLPPTTQLVINAAFFLAAAWMALRGYAGGKKASPAEESRDLAILAGGAITDMKPVRQVDEKLGLLVVETKRVADSLDHIHAILHARQLADAAAEEDELRDRIRDLERNLADAGRSPEQRRRPR